MPNPVMVSCQINGITRVALNVKTGIIKLLDKYDLYYLESNRLTGEIAPITNSGFVGFNGDLIIESDNDIDVYLYIYSYSRTGTVNVRADL